MPTSARAPSSPLTLYPRSHYSKSPQHSPLFPLVLGVMWYYYTWEKILLYLRKFVADWSRFPVLMSSRTSSALREGASYQMMSCTSGKNMWRHHTIRCDHTISKKWTFVHTEISFDHTINIWSHRKKFVHTINLQDHTVIILFTPCTFWSHSWNFCSHHLNFVHTINLQNHTVISSHHRLLTTQLR